MANRDFETRVASPSFCKAIVKSLRNSESCATLEILQEKLAGSKAEGSISKRMLQGNKAHQIF